MRGVVLMMLGNGSEMGLRWLRSTMVVAAVGAWLLISGCAARSAATEGAGGAGGSGVGGSDVGGSDVGGSDVGGSGGSSGGGAGGAGGASVAPLALFDDGLVARYYIDEADMGQAPPQLLDSAPGAVKLALDLNYTAEMEYAGPDGRRGLHSTAYGADGRASVLVNGTKIQQRLAGSVTATLEVVVTADALHLSSSRFIHVGTGTESGYLTLSAPSSTRVLFYWRKYTLLGEYVVPLHSGRMVIHAVFDSSRTNEGERARLYFNGTEALRVGGTPPQLNQSIQIPDDTYFTVGNRAVGGRSFLGTSHYAAVYDVAMPPARVVHHAHVLLVNDDTP